MQNNRILIIIYEDPLLQFILLSQSQKGSTLLHSKQLRVFSKQIDFSISEYILQALSAWGNEIDVTLVTEMIPLVPQSGRDGVEEILLFCDKEYENLSRVTKHIWFFNQDIEKEGTSIIAKQYDFEALFHVDLGFRNTGIVSFHKNQRGVVRIIGESDRYDIQEIIQKQDFKAQTEQYSILSDYHNIVNYLYNATYIPSFHLEDVQSCMLTYVLTEYRFRDKKKSKKLEIGAFGKKNIDTNILIIGGTTVRCIENIHLYILACVSALNLTGAFSVFVDTYGLCNALFKIKDSSKFIDAIRELLFDFWGYIVVPDSRKKRSIGRRIGEILYSDNTGEKKENIFDGGVYTVPIEKKSKIEINFENNYFVKDLQDSFRFFCEDAFVCVDSRDRPVQDILKSQANKDELLLRWLKGIQALV